MAPVAPLSPRTKHGPQGCTAVPGPLAPLPPRQEAGPPQPLPLASAEAQVCSGRCWGRGRGVPSPSWDSRTPWCARVSTSRGSCARAAHHPRRPRFRLSASCPPRPPAALARCPFSAPPPREVSRLHTWAPGGPSSVGGEPGARQEGLAGGLSLHTHEKAHLTSVEHGPVAELRPAALGS